MARLTEADFTTSGWVGCGGLHMVPLCREIIVAELAPDRRRLLDMGCGCGAIGISLLDEGVATELVMTDIDEVSTQFAAVNALKLLSSEKRAVTRTYQADVWNNNGKNLPEEPFDVIVCNAPLSVLPPQDKEVNPFRFCNEDWEFQRRIFSDLYGYLNHNGIVIIKDLFGATWHHDFSVPCVATIVGDADTLQRSMSFFAADIDGAFPRTAFQLLNPQTRLNQSAHCLRVFRRPA